MSAETMRKAAALMRERAQAVALLEVWTDDHWTPEPDMPLTNFTASWSPVVALAVAEWLDEQAGSVEMGEDDNWPPQTAALAAARAYLGEASA